jgi:WD40 repeat protein
MTTQKEHRVRRGVFVSYARRDGESLARDLCQRLLAHGVPVWHDRSSMEGGRDWWDQIKRALREVEFLVLIMTPGAVQSETVRQEWRIARQQGVCVFPVIADAGIGMDVLPRWMRTVHWYDLAHEEAKLLNDLNTQCRVRRVPFMVEPLPVDFVPRNSEFEQLKSSLLTADREEPVAITASLRGAGGYGKTTLAKAICHDEDIQTAFDDGVLWVTLGEAPSSAALLSKINDLIETLGDERPSFEGIDAASARLREMLEDQDVLLVIDDVWRASDVRPFLGLGPRCARLMTTRRADTVPPDSVNVFVDQMQLQEATTLISRGLPRSRHGAYGQLAERLGEWPLLLKLANSWLRKRIQEAEEPVDKALSSLDAALVRRGVIALDARNAEERNTAVAKTLDLSFSSLISADQSRLVELSIFEEDLDIPLTVLERYWARTGGLDALETEETCQRLFDESFLVSLSLAERTIRLHDAIRSWLLTRSDEKTRAEMNCRLLGSYASSGTDWQDIADDGYLHAHLGRHLVAAGRQEELKDLLLNLAWIEARLGVNRGVVGGAWAEVHAMMSDYDLMQADPEVAIVREALLLSTHVIAKRPDQVGFQLFGRLGSSDSARVRHLCDQAIAMGSCRALVPLRSALTSPGNLRLTLGGHAGTVQGAVFVPRTSWGLSWSVDGNYRLWDLQRGSLIHELNVPSKTAPGLVVLAERHRALLWYDNGTMALWDLESGRLGDALAGHEREVLGALLLSDGRSALSWSRDLTLRLWDLVQGSVRHTLTGHGSRPIGVQLLASDRQALSWSEDRTLKLWDLEQGRQLLSLKGHDLRIQGVALIGDREAVTWARDRTIRLWDLVEGRQVRAIAAHAREVRGLALLADGQEALTWSTDRTLKRWDLRSGEMMVHFAGHEAAVLGAAVLEDKRQALSWSADGTLRIWSLDQGESIAILSDHKREVTGCLVLEGGQRALSWSADHTIKLWDIEHRRLISTLAGHEDAILGLTQCGHLALSWAADRTLKLWDLKRTSLDQSVDGEEPLRGLTTLSDGHMALSWSHDRAARVWDLDRGLLLSALKGHTRGIRGTAVSADERQVLSWSFDGTLKLWDLKRFQPLHTFIGHERSVVGAMFLNQEKSLLSWSNDGTLKLWDLGTRQLMHTFSGHRLGIKGVRVLSFDQVLSWSHDGGMKIWDLRSQTLVRSLAGHDRSIDGVSLRVGVGQALSWSEDRTLRIWNLVTGELLRTLTGHEGAVRGTRVVADRRQVLSWSQDRTLRVWDLDSGAQLHKFAQHTSAVTGAFLFGDGKRALSWGKDGLKLWDLKKFALQGELPQSIRKTRGVALIGDGPHFLTATSERELQLWNADTMMLLDVYVADAELSIFKIESAPFRILAGDAFGRIHVIRLDLPEAR